MSRIGKLPINIPQGVEIKVNDENVVTVKGKLGQTQQQVNPKLTIKIENNQLSIERQENSKTFRAMHGLYRSLVNNIIVGVSEGYKNVLVLNGVGYKATANGQLLELSLGYSHDILMELPEEVKVNVVQEKRSAPVLTLTSYDKQILGEVTAKIRSFRKPEPYKGKGIRFQGEEIRRKQGKTASK